MSLPIAIVVTIVSALLATAAGFGATMLWIHSAPGSLQSELLVAAIAGGTTGGVNTIILHWVVGE